MRLIDFAREQEGSDSCAEACWSHSEESSRSFLSRRSCCCPPCDCSYFALFCWTGICVSLNPPLVTRPSSGLMCFSLLTNCSPGHVVILDTVGSLLMLLRSNSRKAYRMFFQDALQAIQGAKTKWFCECY